NPMPPDKSPMPDTELTPAAAPTAVLTLPVLPLKNTVLFPNLFLPLSVGRPNSVAAVEAALASEEKTLVAVAQRDGGTDQPGLGHPFSTGTRALIKKMARTAQGMDLLVQGAERVTILQGEQTEPYLRAQVQVLPIPDDRGPEVEALFGEVMKLA